MIYPYLACLVSPPQDSGLHATAVDIFLGVITRPKLPDILLQTVAWVLGEYGSLAASLTGSNRATPQQVWSVGGGWTWVGCVVFT